MRFFTFADLERAKQLAPATCRSSHLAECFLVGEEARWSRPLEVGEWPGSKPAGPWTAAELAAYEAGWTYAHWQDLEAYNSQPQ